MCLDKLEKFKVHKNYGWQVFENVGGKLHQQFHHPPKVGHFPREMFAITNQWQHDINTYKIYPLGYPTGFHIFLRKKDALAFKKESNLGLIHSLVVKKVYFKNIVAKGIQRVLLLNENRTVNTKVVVARQRYIVEEGTA